MTDIELWTRILKGDKVAFEELYHRYYSSLFGYALRLNFDEETASPGARNPDNEIDAR